MAPLRSVLAELIDEGFTVIEERVLSVPALVLSWLELVVELMRLAWASFLFIVHWQPLAFAEAGL